MQNTGKKTISRSFLTGLLIIVLTVNLIQLIAMGFFRKEN